MKRGKMQPSPLGLAAHLVAWCWTGGLLREGVHSLGQSKSKKSNGRQEGMNEITDHSYAWM